MESYSDQQLQDAPFFDRDLSWLSFNGRVLAEASRTQVPLLERIKFLSIFSSNLDEFYRVRMPVLQALKKISKKNSDILPTPQALSTARDTINSQQEQFGQILRNSLLPELQENNIHFYYGGKLPNEIKSASHNYFVSEVLAFLQIISVTPQSQDFFPENNLLYLAVGTEQSNGALDYIINIPSIPLPRFYKYKEDENTHIIFLEDIIKAYLHLLFPHSAIRWAYTFKITRTAELELDDEYNSDIAEQIERQLEKRDLGKATRLLHEPGFAPEALQQLKSFIGVDDATLVQGGNYHNLKDLADFPVNDSNLSYDKWPKLSHPDINAEQTLFAQIRKSDILINPPYQTYDSVLQFFNEAATDQRVTEIYTTLYRVAKESLIVNALITAAKNGKKVSVLVELKARFDEANNIKWAKKMKAAGVQINYSVTALKVHAKAALIKYKNDQRITYLGLFATGNFNETTANFYTDHILMTANREMLRELELLFLFLSRRKQPESTELMPFKELLVAQFNLKERFCELIDREIANSKNGLKASITIKLNNLEEEQMVMKLYEAADAGVDIQLIIRGICRLVPRANIVVRRIVDRYLEHGRLFLFHNAGNEELFMGSADWMARNIYRRIEVCFPIYDTKIKTQLKHLLALQLADNIKAVRINSDMENVTMESLAAPLASQQAIYQYLKTIHENN